MGLHVNWKLKLKNHNRCCNLKSKKIAGSVKEMLAALYCEHGTCARAARALGISDRSFRWQMVKHGIEHNTQGGRPVPVKPNERRVGGGSVMHSKPTPKTYRTFAKHPCRSCDLYPCTVPCDKPEAYAIQIENNGVGAIYKTGFDGVHGGTSSVGGKRGTS